jgi:zinc/manganese transport system substrate-binding protein
MPVGAAACQLESHQAHLKDGAPDGLAWSSEMTVESSMSRIKLAVAIALSVLVSAGSAVAQDTAKIDTAKIKVVASFSILADLVRQVGGARVDVSSLVGPDSDMHGYEPTPNDVKTVAAAQVFVINGLGLEGWADRLVKSTGFKGEAVVASRDIKALEADDDHDHGHGHAKGDAKAHDHGRYDPHAWQDVANVKRYAENIRNALIAVDPSARAQYEAQAARFTAELDGLDRDIKAAFAPIPKARRKVITSHDAFEYFADAYEVAFLAPQGVGNEAEPSAKRVAELIRQIKKEGVKVVFLENISNPRVVERISRETGAKSGGTLYSDALSGPDGPAATYIAMMRHNAKLIADGLAAR